MLNVQDFIEQYQLEKHPEGGFYKRTFLHSDNLFSSILFLLTKNNFSAFHKIKSDEQWNWYFGDAIIIHEIDLEGKYHQTILSNKKEHLNFQYVVKANHWFASECVGDEGFAFCGCTVVPAFSFEEFELAERDKLIKEFPQHQALINKFTRQ
ncbi:MAG: cupin domain-containing protein [Saprospirales bacterium]|nr:cupin domain-containing protein [Saprospirales bacterium]